MAMLMADMKRVIAEQKLGFVAIVGAGRQDYGQHCVQSGDRNPFRDPFSRKSSRFKGTAQGGALVRGTCRALSGVDTDWIVPHLRRAGGEQGGAIDPKQSGAHAIEG